MRKDRKVQVLSIIALVLAITGMTLGFAAFSSTLNISSSANVTPNSDDFKIAVYGLKDEDAIINSFDGDFSEENLSLTKGYAYILADQSGGVEAGVAEISQATLSISNININFISTGLVFYRFLIRNEGKYDAYFNCSSVSSAENVQEISPNCVAAEGTSEQLANEACNGIAASIGLRKLVYDWESPFKSCTDEYYKMTPGQEEIFGYYVYYDGPYADGNFSAEFPDVKLEFTTTPPSK